jgi:hypothetical protein
MRLGLILLTVAVKMEVEGKLEMEGKISEEGEIDAAEDVTNKALRLCFIIRKPVF